MKDIVIEDKNSIQSLGCKMKVRNLKPTGNNFHFIPKYCPQLRPFVRSVEWNCLDCHLNIVLAETPLFEAYSWFSTINKRHQEALKSPFCDLEQDAVAIVFMDACGKEVARYKFKNLELTFHSCHLDLNSTGTIFGIDHENVLEHHIMVKYGEVENMGPSEEKPITPSDEPLDDEWKEVEVI